MSSYLDRTSDWLLAAREAQYRAKHLADLKHVSVRHLERYFGEAFGRCPQHWLDETRLLESVFLITNGTRVKETAVRLGFASTAHFCRRFKAFFGCSPSQFLQIHEERKAERKAQFQRWFPGEPVPEDWLEDPNMAQFRALLGRLVQPLPNPCAA